MNRRGFLSTLLKASAGAAVVYSFPSVIVPKNIVEPQALTWFGTPIESVIPDGLFIQENSVYFMAKMRIPYIWLNQGLETSYNSILKSGLVAHNFK